MDDDDLGGCSFFTPTRSPMAKRCKISHDTVAQSEKGSYVLKISGYAHAKETVKNGDCLKSSTDFTVGSDHHRWAVTCYPNGSKPEHADCVSLYLRLVDCYKDIKAKFRFSLLDEDGEPVPAYSFSNDVHTFSGKSFSRGHPDFIKKADLEASPYLREDCFSVRCDVTVVKIGGERRRSSKGARFVDVPPSNLHLHLGDLLKSREGADVTFCVAGEKFPAHRSVLEARSPVFKAELCSGDTKEKAVVGGGSRCIEIRGVEPHVFRSLLHFMYTDSVLVLPETARRKGEPRGDVVMAGHLLVAADRYGVERLKLICERKLCNHVGSGTVATSLALAEQHGCRGLKEACFEFLASPPNLEAMVASDGYQHLKRSCPNVIKELIAGFLPAELKAAKDIVMELCFGAV